MAETTLLRVIATRPEVWGVKNNNRVEYKNLYISSPEGVFREKISKKEKKKKKKRKGKKKKIFNF